MISFIPVTSPGRDFSRYRKLGIPAQQGLTLIELMISMVIGLLLLAGMATLFSNQSITRSELDKATRQIENGRYATQLLQEDLQLAGYLGEYSNATVSPGFPAALPDPCATSAATVQTGLALHVQGYDSPTVVPAALLPCLPNVNHVPGTDILLIRRTEIDAIDRSAALPAQIYLQSGTSPPSPLFQFVMDVGANVSKFNLVKKDMTTPAQLRGLVTHIYFVSPCNVPAGGAANCTGSSDDNGNPVPTLKRLDLVPGASASSFSIVPLVEGIENLQLDYGIDYTNGVMPTPGLDGAPDCYVSNPSNPAAAEIAACPASATTYFAASNDVANWANVMTVRINVLARNNDKSSGYIDKKTYNLGLAGTTTATSDAYKRHVFSELVRLVNPSSRRE